MLDKNGEVVPLEQRRMVPRMVVDATRHGPEFAMLKWLLDADEYFVGAHVLVIPDADHFGRWRLIHRNAETVMRSIGNVNLDFISERIRPGMYLFEGDDCDVGLASSWKEQVALMFRASLENAEAICTNKPDHEVFNEWSNVLSMRLVFDAKSSARVVFAPTCAVPNAEGRDYYGDVIFSHFVRLMYAKCPKTTFFSAHALRRYFDPEGEFAFIGKRRNMLMQRYRHDTGETETTVFFPMNEENGFFDYSRFDNFK